MMRRSGSVVPDTTSQKDRYRRFGTNRGILRDLLEPRRFGLGFIGQTVLGGSFLAEKRHLVRIAGISRSQRSMGGHGLINRVDELVS